MMIEEILRAYLLKKLNIDVVFEEMGSYKKDFVRLEKIGSSKKNHINRASFAIQSYGSSLNKAARLNERVKHVLEDFQSLKEIGSIKLQTDYNFTDISTKRYRYQAIFDIYY